MTIDDLMYPIMVYILLKLFEIVRITLLPAQHRLILRIISNKSRILQYEVETI